MLTTIRRASLEDATDIAKIHIRSWQDTYKGIIDETILKNLNLSDKVNHWKSQVVKTDTMTLVAFDENGITGFLCGGSYREETTNAKACEVYALYINTTHHGKGIGKLLLNFFTSYYQQHNYSGMYIRVLKDNKYKQFYIQNGGTLSKTFTISIGKQELEEEEYFWDLKHRC